MRDKLQSYADGLLNHLALKRLPLFQLKMEWNIRAYEYNRDFKYFC